MHTPKITYNNDMSYTLWPDQINFDSRDEAEFFYISRYHDARVTGYNDYNIDYSSVDKCTITAVFLDDAMIRAAYHFKQINHRPTREDIRVFFTRYIHKIPTDAQEFSIMIRG